MTEFLDTKSYFGFLSETIENLSFSTMNQIAETLLHAYDRGRVVYLFGNGGSAALASHFACDLGKGTANGTSKRFRVLALTDNVPLITAWSNDSRFEDIFAEQLTNFVQRDDVAFAISCSGNSPNVVRALQLARQAGAITVGLTGYQGGKMKEFCDQCMIVPSDNMQIIEDLHLCLAHAVFTTVRRRIFQLSEAAAAAH